MASAVTARLSLPQATRTMRSRSTGRQAHRNRQSLCRKAEFVAARLRPHLDLDRLSALECARRDSNGDVDNGPSAVRLRLYAKIWIHRLLRNGTLHFWLYGQQRGRLNLHRQWCWTACLLRQRVDVPAVLNDSLEMKVDEHRSVRRRCLARDLGGPLYRLRPIRHGRTIIRAASREHCEY